MAKTQFVTVKVLQAFVATLPDNVYYGVPGEEMELPAKEANEYEAIGWVEKVQKTAAKVVSKPDGEKSIK